MIATGFEYKTGSFARFYYFNSTRFVNFVFIFMYSTLFFNVVKCLQECESSLKHKTELIAKLEGKSFAMTEALQKMEEK